MISTRVSFLFVVILLHTAIYGQYKVDYEHYSTNDGLSHGSIVNMMKDSKGFMWFCTWDGLNRFDGVNFKTFKTVPGDNLSLSSNRIRIMVEDKFNSIWLETYDERLFRLDLETESFYDEVSKINDSLTGNIEQLFLSSTDELWLATKQDGLFRIVTDSVNKNVNSYHYRSGTDADYSIDGKHIKLIFEDARQNIWFATEKDLVKLRRSNDFLVEALSPDQKNPQHANAYSCGFPLDDQVVLGTEEGNLVFYDSRINLLEKIRISTSPVLIIYADDKRIYAGTGGDGLAAIDRNTRQNRHRYLESYLRSVYSIFEDSQGLIWLETNSDGVVKVDPEDQSTKLFTQRVDVENVRHVNSHCKLAEANNVLWMALKGGGFGYYERSTDKLAYFYNEPGSSQNYTSNFVYCFDIDASNVLWLCTYRKGIEKFTILKNNFHFKIPDLANENYLSSEVRAVFEDHLGILWIATKSGEVYLLDAEYNIITLFSDRYNLSHALVYAITEDDHQNIWLGTKGDGIYKVVRQGNSGYRITHFKHRENDINSLSDDNVYSIEQASDGILWIATYGGGLNRLEIKNDKPVFTYNTVPFRNYPDNCCKRIRQLKEDAQGNLWLATTEGLVFFNPHQMIDGSYRFYQFKKKTSDINSLGNNDVYCIYQDRTDTLWFGTLGGGLQKLIQYPADGKPARFEVFTKENGMSSDVILSIEADEDNNLWMSSENGIIKYNRSRRIFKNYNEHDGINAASFSEAASAKRKNGDIVFGTYNGIYYFKPDEIIEETENCNAYITGLNVLNEPVTANDTKGILSKSMIFTDRLVLKHNQNIFELSFVALDYRATDKIQYSYKLEGYDDHWRQTQMGNAIYTKVPPGNYTFTVKLMNPEIVLSQPVSLQIHIKKPYWKTHLAYALYLLMALIILYFAYRILGTMLKLRNKIAVEKQLSELKIKFFTNISHELRTPLTLIQGPVKEIFRSEKLSKKGREYLKLVDINTERMLRLVNELLYFRKIQNDKMQLKLTHPRFDIFVEQICNHFRNLAIEKHIEFSVDLKTKNTRVWIDEEKMDIVIFNLLSNAFKFTPEGKKIRIVLEREGDLIVLSVQDQGIGINESKKKLVFQRFANIHEASEYDKMSTGLGLSLSKELIELHNGTISFNSEKGRGTTFYIKLQSGKKHFDSEKVVFLTEDPVRENHEKYAERENSNRQETDGEIAQYSGDNNYKNILIVEDDGELRKFIKDIFSGEFRIYEAGNGREAYEKTLVIKPEMIISDVMMPEMDGIEMLGRLRDNFDTSHIPVILLTAKSSVESRIEGLTFGADAYITKPFNSIHLKTLVNSLMEQRKKLIDKFSNTIKVADFTDEELIVTDRDGEFLRQVIEIIEENLSDPDFKVDVLSKAVGMGRTHFFDKLKGLTHLSPIDFIKEYRLNKALLFMDSGELTISEVSYKAGFNDPGYFSKCFKEKFRKTPSQYIREK